MAVFETPVRRMTLEEFKALPEGPPYYEFEEGELIPMSSPSPTHQDIVSLLHVVLRLFILARKLGRVVAGIDVFLPDGRGFIPDLAFVAADRLNLFNPIDDKIYGAPNLVVEVLSSDEARDRTHKFKVYYNNGVAWYWIINQHTLEIEEYRATAEGYLRTASVDTDETFEPKLFPGLTIDLAALLSAESADQLSAE